MSCRIELFGEVRLVREDRVVRHFRTRKAAHLLACLALSPGRSYTREVLVDRFWPDAEPEAGRDSLITALSALRKALEPGGVPAGAVLIADRQSVRLNPAAVTTDVTDFQDTLQEAARAPEPRRRAELLGRAVGYYQGELVRDCYDDWLLAERRRWSERHLDALLKWAEALEEAGDLEKALDVAAQAAGLDPLREEACARQVRIYGALERFSDARACYREYEHRLGEEAGATPPPYLRDLVDDLDARRVPAAPRDARTAVGVERRAPPAQVSPLDAVAAARFVALPISLNRFYGREAEIARLVALLQPDSSGGGPSPTMHGLEPEVRLVTVTGPGGTGKTRLAVEAAHRLAGAYGGRAVFVPLESLDDPARVPGTLARALGLAGSSEADPLDSVAAAVGAAECLMILDNCEHLIARPGPVDLRSVVCRLLTRMPALRCLVTSRQPLAVAGERELHLAPLSTPAAAGMACESVALFLDRARSIKPGFARSPEEEADVAALCERLEGLPLAIEMAATWTRVLPARLIRERLERSAVALESRRQDTPLRHRSLRAALEWSFDLLEPPLRSAFAAFSVFRGGWSLEAAEAVVGAGALEFLADLAERSLLVVDEEGPRYRYLESVREFAGERLCEQGELAADARERHARYYLGLAEEAAASRPMRPVRPWAELGREHPNLNAALEWLAASGRGEELAKTVASLNRFWVEDAHYRPDGIGWTERALSLHTEPDAVRADALLAAGHIARHTDRYGGAGERYAECLSIARDIHDARRCAAASLGLARVAAERGDSAEAKRFADECLQLCSEIADPSAVADTYMHLSGIIGAIGDLASHERLLSESASLMRHHGLRRMLAQPLYGLAALARERGDPDTARALWEECVSLDEEAGVRGGGALWGLGRIADEGGDLATAARWYGRSLRENLARGNRAGVADGLHTLAERMLGRELPGRCARLFGASLLQRSLTGEEPGAALRLALSRLVAELQSRLGAERCEALLQEGWHLDPEAAIETALADVAADGVALADLAVDTG